MADEKKHKLTVEEDHDFFHFFLDLMKKRKKRKEKESQILSDETYQAVKNQLQSPSLTQAPAVPEETKNTEENISESLEEHEELPSEQPEETASSSTEEIPEEQPASEEEISSEESDSGDGRKKKHSKHHKRRGRLSDEEYVKREIQSIKRIHESSESTLEKILESIGEEVPKPVSKEIPSGEKKPLEKKIPGKKTLEQKPLKEPEKQRVPKHTKTELEFETAKQLKEAARIIREMKSATGTREVFEKVRYFESLEDKVQSVKEMMKNLEIDFFKMRLPQEEYKKRRFEYLEALRFLEAQERIRDKALAEGKIKSPDDFVPETGIPGFSGSPSESISQAFAFKSQQEMLGRLQSIEEKLGRQEMSDEEKNRWKETITKIEQINRAVTQNPETQEQITKKIEELSNAIKGGKISRGEEIVFKKPSSEKPFKFAPKETPRPVPVPEKKQREVEIPEMKTPIDSFMEILRQQKECSFQSLANLLGWSIESVERVGLVMEKKGLVDVHYPAIVTKKPSISFLKEIPEQKPIEVSGKVIDEYGFVVDFVPANIKILEIAEEHRPVYKLVTPAIGVYTRIFFEKIADSISQQIPFEISEVTDEKKSAELKERFFRVAKQEISKYLTKSSASQIDTMTGMLLHSMYGLGQIEVLMGDNMLEEIGINSTGSPVAVYHKKFGWMKSTVPVSSEEETFNYASQIARKIGREITVLNPILDAHLVSGDRVTATLYPISGFGNTLTIRRFARRPWTIIDFIGESHTMNIEMASILWLAMQYEMSVLVAGGTASGKTSCLNALLGMIPSYHRTISIEDVREITLPKFMDWNWIPFTTRNPNPEGKGSVSMLELLQSSLRMRPDRIVLGEIRKKKEAEVLFEAMHTGHSVYSTIHANSSQQVLRRLIEPPISLPPLEIEAIDLVLVQYRDRKRNLRRTYELSEIEAGASGQLSINTIFKWNPRNDDWESLNPATKLISQINLHTGMTETEIRKDLEARASVLLWMQAHNIGSIDDVGKIMNLYYSEPQKLIQAAKSNSDPKTIIGEAK